ncbi:MAG: hypothetical protein IT531_00050, partial [Burkholderiales bacterium]|nr:hypothetical protein [Burkholderiales bacterium]
MADYAPGGPLYEPPTFASDMSARKRALQNPVTPATLAQAGARARLDAPSIGPTDASMPRSGGAVAAIAAAPGQAYRYLAGSGAKGVRILAELAGDPESTDYATQRARNIDHRTAMVEASLSSQGRVSPLTVSRGFGQALTQAPTMAAGLWAKAPFAIAGILGFAMPAAAHAYHDLRESGLDASLALPGAIGKGLLEYATELPTFKVLQKMPLPRVVDAFRGDAQALGQLVRYHAVSNGIEFGTEEVSTAGDWLIDRALKDPTATLERLGHDMKQTAAQMAVQAPATAGMGHAMRRAPDVARAVTDRVMPQRALGRALDEAVTTTQFTDPAGPALARMQPRGEISDREVFGPSVPAVAPPTRVAVPSQPPAPATQQASAQAPTGASPAQPNPAQAPATTETPRPDIQAILARVMGRQGAAEALESQQPDRQAVQPAPTPQAPQDLPQQPTAPAPLPRPSAVIAPAQERATPLAAAPTPQTQRTAGAVLQNRDRSSDASITQMNAIAGNPDPARLSISRTMDSGAPIVFANADLAPAGAMGREDVAVDAAGKRVKVRYAVVEADSVLASHRVDGTARPEYTSDATPGRLRAINNGRTAGLQAAYERGTAGAYREGIAQDAEMLGIDPRQMAAMRAPMLVRIMSAADVTADIGDRSNAPQVASLSAVEHAANDARRIALPDLRFAEDGSPSADALRQFVQAMPAQEQAELAPNGVPTAQAEDRLLGAVFHQAYGPQLTELYAQAADPEAKGVLRALAIAAPDMAALEGAGEYDIRDAVRDAAQAFVSGRRRNIRSADIAAQADLTLSSDARNVLELLARGFRRPQAIGAILADAARFARAQAEAPEGDMFGAVPRAGRAAVFERIAHETETGLGNTSGRGPPSPAPVRGESGAAEPESGYGGRDLSPDRAEGRAQPVERGTGEPVASESDARSPEPDRSDPADVERYVNQQIDLFVDGGPLFQRESGARPDSGARGQEARAAAAASIRSWNLRSPGAILARAIATSLVARGRASLEGQIVRTAEELAFLAQIYRDPRFETLRYFLVDASGRVVGQFGISSRLPTSTTAFLDDPDQFISKLDHRMRAAGAVGYWMLHNHPSGFAEASNADLRTTHYIARRLAGFRGHVIIDHDEFSLIKRDGDFEDHIPMGHGGQDPLRQKAPGLGNIISSPGALAFM